MRAFGSIVIAALIGLLVAPPIVAARVRLKCRDGVLSPPTRVCRPPFCSCDADQACDGVCTFVVPVFCELTCSTRTMVVPVGAKRVVECPPGETNTPTVGSKARCVFRCRRHPGNRPCPTTTTTSTTSTTMPCPTTTTLGAPPCQGLGGSCFGVCLGGQTCADDGSGQCVCSGPLQCGVNGVCGGSCPQGQTCAASPVPAGCTPTGTCDCRLGCGMHPDTEMCVGTCPEGTLCLSTAGGPCSCVPSDAHCDVINQQGMCGAACPGIRQMCLNEFQGTLCVCFVACAESKAPSCGGQCVIGSCAVDPATGQCACQG